MNITGIITEYNIFHNGHKYYSGSTVTGSHRLLTCFPFNSHDAWAYR